MKQAAEVLGISSEGVRKRIKRGNLDSEKAPDGKVYVWLDDDRTEDRTKDNGGTDDLTEVLREQVELLHSELEDWKRVVTTRDEELRRKDHIIAALTERIPELEAPASSQEATDRPKTASEDGRGVEDQEPAAAPQRAKSRLWWRRIFR